MKSTLTFRNGATGANDFRCGDEGALSDRCYGVAMANVSCGHANTYMRPRRLHCSALVRLVLPWLISVGSAHTHTDADTDSRAGGTEILIRALCRASVCRVEGARRQAAPSTHYTHEREELLLPIQPFRFVAYVENMVHICKSPEQRRRTRLEVTCAHSGRSSSQHSIERLSIFASFESIE